MNGPEIRRKFDEIVPLVGRLMGSRSGNPKFLGAPLVMRFFKYTAIGAVRKVRVGVVAGGKAS
jgi:hypothetical protein